MPRASYYPKSGNVPPRIEVQQVDLELVKKEVAARGGLAKVDQCREWRQIARAMVCMFFVCGMSTRGCVCCACARACSRGPCMWWNKTIGQRGRFFIFFKSFGARVFVQSKYLHSNT